MIGKIIAGQSFGGTVGYVMKKDAEVLDSEGVNPPEVKDLVQDFEDQGQLNPRIKNKVGHISLSFSEQDKDKLTDKTMTGIGRTSCGKWVSQKTWYADFSIVKK